MSKYYSKSSKINEIIKCGKDPVYFINKYVYIQHPVRGRIKFDTYSFQDDVVRSLQKNRFNIVLKSRQLGLSTIGAAYAVWDALFHKDRNILVIATKAPTAANFVKKCKVALKSLPNQLLMSQYESNQTEIRFSNGSRIMSIPTSEDAGRSEAISLLICDEAAWIRNFSDLWTGLYPTISTGGNAFILSTPNGVGGMYYKLWVDAVSGENGFNPIKLPWDVHPEHDQEWFDKETKGLSKKQISQEFLCDFLTSGETFLQPEEMMWLRELIEEPKKREGWDKKVWVWDDPEPDKRYVISADVARGDGQDYSTFHIVDADEANVVAEYMGKSPPEILGEMMMEYGKRYNNALAIPENNTFGYMTAVYLRDNGYPRLYYAKHKGDPFRYVSTDSSEIPGFSTQSKSRIHILTKLEELIRNKLLNSRSSRLLNQLQSFVWIGSKPQASKDSNDDLVISLAIAMYIVGGTFQHETLQADNTIALLNSTRVYRGESKHSELIYSINNQAQPLINPALQINGFINNKNVHKPRQHDDPYVSKYNLDLSWLLK